LGVINDQHAPTLHRRKRSAPAVGSSTRQATYKLSTTGDTGDTEVKT